MNEQSLVPVEQKEIQFYDDDLIAIRANDRQIYVSVRHLSDALGLTRQGQIRRINRQSVLSDGHFKGAMMTPKGKRDANWLRVDLVPQTTCETGVPTSDVEQLGERRAEPIDQADDDPVRDRRESWRVELGKRHLLPSPVSSLKRTPRCGPNAD